MKCHKCKTQCDLGAEKFAAEARHSPYGFIAITRYVQRFTCWACLLGW